MADEEYNKARYQALAYGIEQFDKNVLFISSGALGISFGFIENVVPLATAKNKCLLLDSWYCFAGVIFISLIAHFISMLAIRWSITKDGIKEDIHEKISNRWNYFVRSLNILMIVGLLAGIILLITFVKQNI